jgi:uncharacterized peroxidase-related enzyme
MRLPSYQSPPRARQRAFVRLTRALGGELDDVGKVCLRRPDVFGRPFLRFSHSLLRRPSTWSVGERELFAAVVSRANRCEFCVGTHSEIAALELGRDALTRLDEGAMTPRASAAAAFADALTRDPTALAAAVTRARAAGVEDDALAEVAYVVFMFNTINRIADALGFEHRSDRHRRRGAAVLRRIGYRLPAFLEADEGDGPRRRPR